MSYLILPKVLFILGTMVTKRHLKELRELGKKKLREEQGHFLVEGVRIVEEAAESDFVILEVLHTEAFARDASGRRLLQKLKRKNPVFNAITEREMEIISDTVTAQGIAAVVTVRRFAFESLLQPRKHSLLVGFDGVSDPGNLGSMIRTCDWFGVDGIVVGRDSVDLYNSKVLRSTMGAFFHLPIVTDVNLPAAVNQIRNAGYTIYVADAGGETHAEDVQYADRAFLILGNEAHGVSSSLSRAADMRVAIRRYGLAESLNVGVACGVLLAVVRTTQVADRRNIVHP